MPNNTVIKYKDTSRESSSSRIISFPRRYMASYFQNNTSLGLIDSKEQSTKESIEAIVYEILVKEKLLENEQDINPLDSIYLCDLRPDIVDYSRIENIKIYANITDLSDSISFNDGMDD